MFTSPYKAAVVQMNSQIDIDQNLEKAQNYIKEAASQGAKVIGLPENFAFLGGLSMRMEQAEVIAEKVPDFLSQNAKMLDVYILGGSYPVPTTEGKVFNRSPLYNPKGEEIASYDKIHLFDVELSNKETYKESDYVKAGVHEPAVYSDSIIGNWGLSVCYDLRFPEYYRLLTDRGATILSIPSAFTHTTGKHHWLPLLRARAIENTSYVFAPAQTGLHGDNRRTWGHALIIDPWGEVVANGGEEPGIALAELNPSRITEVRKSIPSLKHRRF